MATTSTDLERLYGERYGVFLDGMSRVLRDREAAHDVVQEAFARALRQRRRFRGDGSLGGAAARPEPGVSDTVAHCAAARSRHGGATRTGV